MHGVEKTVGLIGAEDIWQQRSERIGRMSVKGDKTCRENVDD
jgi:hypothetical protein